MAFSRNGSSSKRAFIQSRLEEKLVINYILWGRLERDLETGARDALSFSNNNVNLFVLKQFS